MNWKKLHAKCLSHPSGLETGTGDRKSIVVDLLIFRDEPAYELAQERESS
jgi:hypothetical protein